MSILNKRNIFVQLKMKRITELIYKTTKDLSISSFIYKIEFGSKLDFKN